MRPPIIPALHHLALPPKEKSDNAFIEAPALACKQGLATISTASGSARSMYYDKIFCDKPNAFLPVLKDKTFRAGSFVYQQGNGGGRGKGVFHGKKERYHAEREACYSRVDQDRCRPTLAVVRGNPTPNRVKLALADIDPQWHRGERPNKQPMRPS